MTAELPDHSPSSTWIRRQGTTPHTHSRRSALSKRVIFPTLGLLVALSLAPSASAAAAPPAAVTAAAPGVSAESDAPDESGDYDDRGDWGDRDDRGDWRDSDDWDDWGDSRDWDDSEDWSDSEDQEDSDQPSEPDGQEEREEQEEEREKPTVREQPAKPSPAPEAPSEPVKPAIPAKPQPAPAPPVEPEPAPAPVPVAPAPQPSAVVSPPAPTSPPSRAPRVKPTPPALATASVIAGSTDGGTRLTLTGTNLSGATEVTFGGIVGSGLEILSATELAVTTPPRAEPGNVNVRVLTPGGRSSSSSPVHFRFVRPPAISGLSPASGSDAGGTLVTISGSDFNDASQVLFGDQPAAVVTFTPELARVIVPPRQGGGPVSVRLTTIGGTSAVVPAAAFSYAPTPMITAVSPTTGSTDGGTVITISGSHLADTSQVSFGGEAGSDLTVVSDTAVTVRAPERTSTGTVRLTLVTDTGAVGEFPDDAGFSYTPAVETVVESTARTFWPFGLIGMLSWSVWFVRRFLSRHRYTPITNNYTTTTSIVVPVYREDPHVLERCLHTWLAENPTEIILVVDDQDTALLDHLHSLNLPTVTLLEWHHTGKRGALGAGVRHATGDIVVFADSDTAWRPGLLAHIQMPFQDPNIGGVGSRQHVYLPRTNIWRRVAYWMLNTRYLDYVPAMSRRGGVACLSGRTAAYRRSAITPLMPALEKEIFLGRECIAGDDGRLTWLVLAAGYKTVHQDTAQADSMFPAELAAFLRQRVRWSRNSYRCYLTALSQGWLWRQPLITQVTVLQILLTPLTMGAAIWYGTRWIVEGGWIAAAIVLTWAVSSRAIRGTSHLMENPRDLLITPLVALSIATIALPIKFWAALSMNRQGWLTRQDGQRVQGQQEIEVVAHASQG